MVAVLLAAHGLDAQPFRVAVAASDAIGLARPAARTDSLDADQIAALVATAVDGVGGMAAFVEPMASLVVIKPNISIPKASGSGVITDARVVRGVALLVHEAAPQARILIAEAAGGWVAPAWQDCSGVNIDEAVVADGWAASGHRETVAELRGRGVDIELYDLNFDRLDTLAVPGGGYADDEYILPRTLRQADAWINVPVAKPHGAKLTAAVKNRMGIMPGIVYGFDKSSGTEHHAPLRHFPQVLDETLVDIYTLAPEDLCVVDMIVGTEGGAFAGTPKRGNLIVAGTDAVATDLVVARLMGFNPDDLEFADLAWQRGLGPRFLERVDVVPEDLSPLVRRYRKAGADYGNGSWAQHADYGMGARRWTLLGPLPRDQRLTAADQRPVPGQDGWSAVSFFHSDRIDLDGYFDDPVGCAVYAHTTFTMPQADSVRIWAGSDEDMEVWIDGRPVYEHRGRRRHALGAERLPAYLTAGVHQLLVRVEQGRGRFDFSFNICEPIDDPAYAGNRYPGLRYRGESVDTEVALHAQAPRLRYDAGDSPADTSAITIAGATDPMETVTNADTLLVDGVSRPRSRYMIDVLAAAAGPAEQRLDTTLVAILQSSEAWFAYMPFGHEWYPMRRQGLTRYLHWLGLDYGISWGYGFGEAMRTVRGWLAQGRAPLTGKEDDWILISGYRERPGQTPELRLVGADSTWWDDTTPWGDWWGRLATRRWVVTPVVVAQRIRAPIGFDALVDSMAQIAVSVAREPWIDLDQEPWGRRGCPAGLAAWDEWVTEWERLPWTREWALQPWERRYLELNGRWKLDYVAGNHGGLARWFEAAADSAHDPVRRQQLTEAAAGYGEVEAAMQALRDLMPTAATGDPTPEEEDRLGRLHEARGLPRAARAGARRALAALAELIDAEPLPPVADDPLQGNRDRQQVLRWRSAYHKGIADLLVSGDRVEQRHIDGSKPEDTTIDRFGSIPRRTGTTVVVERRVGHGMYRVVEQPSPANGWKARIRIDDGWTDSTMAEPIDLVVWVVTGGEHGLEEGGAR